MDSESFYFMVSSTSLFWTVLGAVIGISAAQKRGFNIAKGIIGGAFLGIFAVFMFAMDSDGRACPFCAEVVKNEAKVCRFCRNDLPPVSDGKPKRKCTVIQGKVR